MTNKEYNEQIKLARFYENKPQYIDNDREYACMCFGFRFHNVKYNLYGLYYIKNNCIKWKLYKIDKYTDSIKNPKQNAPKTIQSIMTKVETELDVLGV